MSILIKNKKAFFDYFILETYQAGLSLSGKMVKLIRNRRVQLEGKYIIFQKNQLQIIGFGNESLTENVSLLLKKSEKKDIAEKLKTKGISAIILSIKQVGRWLKADIALVKGKKNYDKKQAIKNRDIDREVKRNLEF